jgi:biopolymer transport protein ExbB
MSIIAVNALRARPARLPASTAVLFALLAATPTGLRAQEAAPASQPEATAPGSPAAPQALPEASVPATPPAVAQPNASSPAAPAAQPDATLPDTTASTGSSAQTAPADTSPQTAPVDATPPAEEAAAAEQVNEPLLMQDLLPAGERSDIPHDLSPWGMFMAADWVVKAVMIGLAFASLITWTVWLAKTLELAGARTRATRTLKIIRSSATLTDAVGASAQRGGPAALMLRSAAEEVRLSEAALDHADNAGVKERVASALSRIESYAGRRMSRGTGVLATIGSTAPFVGLFGTVWGIMNSFIGISESQTTNLAVVAPGIAEALLATAIGLVAAIPAVIIYNVFARSITGYRQLLADAAAGVERLVSRDLDFRKIPPGSRKAPVTLVAGE